MDYWDECISEAFEDAGIVASKEQMDTVTSWVEGAHDNYSTATGSDVMHSGGPSVYDLQRENENLKDELKQAKHHNECFRSSIMRRRDCSNAWVNNQGDVEYSND